ncbi:ion transporter [Micromonospora sp. WMMA1996]|uniref:potassium channel family protein n=1 Tax=Micromonospora sp. WMMA1996 TaxID=2039878 RepID=UPI000BF38023|nr:potassium channel family protein [Micromonospora sp. WMMA1996]PGH45390.1 ion transporter [Micromonospora sp. WMMA1996]
MDTGKVAGVVLDQRDGFRRRAIGRREQLSAAPPTLLSVVFLAAYAWPILVPQLSRRWVAACEPMTVLVLPFLRPLRALRPVTVVLNLTRRTTDRARGRLALYVTATTVLLVVVSALAVLDAERAAPDASITSFTDALWWAAVTITTVGYGDLFPVTTAGRLVALGLMVGGIGLIGFVTGSLATWIVERVADRNRPEPATAADVAALRDEIAALRARLESGSSAAGVPDRLAVDD